MPDQAHVGSADCACAQVVARCGRVDDGQREAVVPKRQQRPFNFQAAAGTLDTGLGERAAPAPIQDRSLLVGLDDGNPMPVPHRSDRKPDDERALAAATLLGGKYDRAHNVLPFAGKQQHDEKMELTINN